MRPALLFKVLSTWGYVFYQLGPKHELLSQGWISFSCTRVSGSADLYLVHICSKVGQTREGNRLSTSTRQGRCRHSSLASRMSSIKKGLVSIHVSQINNKVPLRGSVSKRGNIHGFQLEKNGYQICSLCTNICFSLHISQDYF